MTHNTHTNDNARRVTRMIGYHMSRETYFNMSLDDNAILYAYVIAHDAVRTNVDHNNSRRMTQRVRDSIARDVRTIADDDDARAIMTRVNNALDVARDTRNARDNIDIDDARSLASFVSYMTRHDDASKQCDRYVRRVARYARVIVNDELLMSRNERNAQRRATRA